MLKGLGCIGDDLFRKTTVGDDVPARRQIDRDDTGHRLDTGDIMRRDGGGFFFFVGRADDMFVCGGENVYPAEVERLLEQHADVAPAAVIAFPDDIKQHIPVAFVVAKPSSTADVTDIKQFTLANGPAYRHPRFIGLLEELPLAGTNKIDWRALFERARSEFSR